MDIRKFIATGCCILVSLTSCGRTVKRASKRPVAASESIEKTTTTTKNKTTALSTTAFRATDTTTEINTTAAIQTTAASAVTKAESVTAAKATATAAPATTAASIVQTTTKNNVTEDEEILLKENLPLCRSAALYCLNDSQYLYSDSLNLYAAPAGMAKLVAASVALKYVDPYNIYTVGSEQSYLEPCSSLADIAQGNILTMHDLVEGMLMVSGNDAAYTVAVATARTLNPDKYMSDSEAIDYFVELMNSFANDIGMYNSHFSTPDGWDADNQYTTASDLVNLAEYVLNDQVIRDIVSTHYDYVTFQTGEYAEWINSNLLINAQSQYYCPECIGLKTGTTDEAGNCLLSAFVKNGKTYISVVTGCMNDDDRYALTLKLYNTLT